MARLPQPKAPEEKFPVLLELLPYRKDDLFYLRDYPLYNRVRRLFYPGEPPVSVISTFSGRSTGSWSSGMGTTPSFSQ